MSDPLAPSLADQIKALSAQVDALTTQFAVLQDAQRRLANDVNRRFEVGKFVGDIELGGGVRATAEEGLHLAASSLRIHGSDLILDGLSRSDSPGTLFRALHDMGNKLVINFNGDYGKGVEVASDFVIDGTMRIHGSDLILDGRSRLNSPDALFRALVDMGHKLVINFNGDYGQGVQVASDLEVGGKLRSSGADCAEQFDLAADAAAEPGSVMVIGAEGRLEPCTAVYDSRVAGVVSGAGGLKTAIVLNDRGGRRAAIALIGSVYCKCDARDAPISAGDLLTTSAMVGHAMRADDASRRFGAVIGKALKPLSTGTGLLPILVSPR